MLKRWMLLLMAMFFGAACAAPAFAAAEQTPQQIVQSIADQLGKAIQGHQAELRQNPEQMIKIIDGIILPHFDTDYAALLVLGRHAREATPAQRVAFARAFYNALTHRYAEGLVAYTRGAVKVLPAQGPLDQRRTIVRTQVLLDSGKNLSVDYAFRKTASGEWKAYDVIIEGISYITNYRNQVDAEVQKEGIEGLIKRLQSEGAGAINEMQQQDGGH
ncbi:MAG: ABC transporter substrate-binding protein [Xanthomonadaceae bacterium]|nr:ABC transporter substrate-binding protein [Xanthomonadaceae bacterium]MBU6476936.1 ABC transporter substrate-binding protein [Xanthomonadaceae bacterium]MDE2224752.1 ABC transporter substrate-binding protein [Xanthomonadaceae bacterium]